MVQKIWGEGSCPEPVFDRGKICHRTDCRVGKRESKENDSLHLHKHPPLEQHNFIFRFQDTRKMAGNFGDDSSL